ncbi:MAG: ChaN family lipoprotein [Pseudomonadota bacterium]
MTLSSTQITRSAPPAFAAWRGRALAITLGWLALAGCAATASPGDPPSAAPTGNPLQGMVWDTEAGRAITPATLIDRLRGGGVVVLGEIHDNPVHHDRQAWLIERIEPDGVAFEMVPEGSEKGIAVFRADGGEAAEIGPAIGWERLGWPEWSLYRPVFEAAGEARITGGGVARADLRRAIAEGAASVEGAGAAAAGLDRALPAAEQAALEAEMVAAHCDMLPASAAPGMVEAQRLRDLRFARAALRAREGSAAARAVLVTGNGHARRDRGVPVYLTRLEPGLEVISLGQVEVTPGLTAALDYAGEGGDLVYDYVWFSADVADRGDPCDAFR